jgi:hypothetical protein
VEGVIVGGRLNQVRKGTGSQRDQTQRKGCAATLQCVCMREVEEIDAEMEKGRGEDRGTSKANLWYMLLIIRPGSRG